MDKKILVFLGIAVLVITSLTVYATKDNTYDVENKEENACNIKSYTENTCDKACDNTNCPINCGGTCGASACGCGR